MRISKMLAALLICVALVGVNNTSQATKISGSKVSKVVEHVCFDTNQSVETEGKNGLNVIFTGIEAKNYHANSAIFTEKSQGKNDNLAITSSIAVQF